MGEFKVSVVRSARKELERIDEPACSRILSRIERLSNNPRPEGCRKLQGATNLWRIRVGEYRVIYSIEDEKKVVDIYTVRHRREVYR